jgi:hypothetical protein
MITTSELAANITIRVLTACGVFFGGRTVWRRRKKRLEGQRKEDST